MAENVDTWVQQFEDDGLAPGERAPKSSGSVSDAADRREAGGEPAGEGALQTLVEFDPQTNEFNWSDVASARRLLGAAYAGQTIERALFEKRIVGPVCEMRTRALGGELETYVCEYRLRRDDGETHWVEERGGWIGGGGERRLICVIRSLESQKQREERLAWLARNDELTGLLNRAHLRQCVDDWIDEHGRSGRKSAYILAGIDDLGAINADFGFDVADVVIVEIAERLKRALAPGDVIGRVAGTKFGILTQETDEESLRATCVKLLNLVRESVVDTKRGGVATSICVGAVELPDGAANSQQAMTRAEAALDQARRLGHSSWSTFSEKTDQISLRRRNSHMSDVILTALNERRIRTAFQPIVADLGEAPSKYECLIRMRDEEGREVPAPDFIPVAERLGLVHLLDRRVLELATNTLAACPNIHLAVNVSMETVKDAVWADGYLSHMRANKSLARRITVELTETQVVDAIDSSIEFVSEIKELGASFAIDDFGAGYTSFRNLKALDIDILKIDGSFVTGVASSRENQLFVRTLLDLARNFGMKTVAEWVDNEADAMLLKGLGVDYLQGFLLGKPEINPSWLPDGAPTERPAPPFRT